MQGAQRGRQEKDCEAEVSLTVCHAGAAEGRVLELRLGLPLYARAHGGASSIAPR